MKCPECDGVGRIHYGEEWCSACNGTGEVQTNEEWLHTLNTEQLAEFICGIQTDGALQVDCMAYEERLMWLKQPHTTKE